MMKTTLQVKSVKARRVSAKLTANDNEETLWSKLSWTEQSNIKKRIDDLQWQLTYSSMQLNKWKELDNGGWKSLDGMREKAQAELDGLMFG